MDVKAYIDSGILELYVAGLLSAEECREVYLFAKTHPEIQDEITAIEQAVKTLAESVHPDVEGKDFEALKSRLGIRDKKKAVPLPKQRKNWFQYSGWAAAVVLAFGLLYFYRQSNVLQNEATITSRDNEYLKEQIIEARQAKDETEYLLRELRDRNITVVPLAGQQVSPQSYAKVYWNPEKDLVYLDAAGLPEPPEGMVYQVWSLKLSPLTPTSLGILDEFGTEASKVFVLANPNESEAFGITLEPAGGSESPTLTQLYTLGAIQSG